MSVPRPFGVRASPARVNSVHPRMSRPAAQVVSVFQGVSQAQASAGSTLRGTASIVCGAFPIGQNLYPMRKVITRGRSGTSALMNWSDEMFVGP